MIDNHLLDIARTNSALVESLYEQYLKDPKSVSADWIEIFKALDILPETQEALQEVLIIQGDINYKVLNLIEAYRKWGYLAAPQNPLEDSPPQEPEQLKLKNFGLSQTDLAQEVSSFHFFSQPKVSLAEMLDALKKTYCSRIGFEFKGIQDEKFERWLQEKIEPNHLTLALTIEQRQMILEQLNKSELFEAFLHTKYPGQKRFSLEGAETFIPMLSALIEVGSLIGTTEYVLGMAHRGRLNVLVNILNKSYSDLFSEFDEGYFPDSFEGSGDVKYHKGFLSDVMTIHGKQVKVTLTPNPSHLESVDPVVEGQVKGKQFQKNDGKQLGVQAILVHGDAAISGQGVVYETLQLSQLSGYSTGGTVHFVINNQVGFTTNPEEGRSTKFCTDIAKAFGLPVFRVNAEDPEACVYATILAEQIRQVFHIDVFIDLLCYRKYGHNEGDEPSFTQPKEYQKIRQKKTIRELYREQLIQEGIVEKFIAEGLEVEFKKALQEAQRGLKPIEKVKVEVKQEKNDPFVKITTAVSERDLKECGEKMTEIPEGFSIHPKLDSLLKERVLMATQEDKPIDYGMAELLAYGTLLMEGYSVRLSGQDSGRGTFTHRHALWVDQVTQQSYLSLRYLKESQGHIDVINSPLSEFAALAFEYGYSTVDPKTLVLWEAQFGDFNNGAQVVIDQYISSGEYKWGQKSNLTLLLPHGYEGQGPEHSSARLERFLTLAANDNLIICNPTTPAQYFHLLRRQALNPVEKPLICLTPKILLRHPESVSYLPELEKGSFETIIDDKEAPRAPHKLIFCSGKIYYELKQLRQKENLTHFALIRVEQLYPFDKEKAAAIIKKYPNIKEYLWVQEEPQNMGAWRFIHPHLEVLLPKNMPLQYLGRKESASPAAGSYALHKKELQTLFEAIKTEKPQSIIDIAHFHRA